MTRQRRLSIVLVVAAAIAGMLLAVTADAATEFNVDVARTGRGSVQSSPPGINCPGTCSARFALGTNVQLTAIPGSGAYVSAWFGTPGPSCAARQAVCTVTVAQNRTITAAFADEPVTPPSPANFDITMTRGLPIRNFINLTPQFLASQQCTPTGFPPTSVTCSVDAPFNREVAELEGTVVEHGTNRTGRFVLGCNVFTGGFPVRAVFSVNTDGSNLNFASFSGGAGQQCAWEIRFADGAIGGQLRGSASISLVAGSTPQAFLYDGDFEVQAFGGSGVYSGKAGRGVFRERGTKTIPSGLLSTMSVADSPTSTFELSLSAARPVALFANPKPGSKVKRSAGSRLIIAAPRGSTCVVTARKRLKVVALGRAADGTGTSRDSAVIFKSAFAGKLSKGVWTLTAKCSAGAGRRTVATTGRARITIT